METLERNSKIMELMGNISIESTTPVYTMGTASAFPGIPVHSIRQYIDKGLIIPFRKESSLKLFSQVDILRLKYFHKLLEEAGLNIAGIRALLSVIPCLLGQLCGDIQIAATGIQVYYPRRR